jgi:hypothetical protein
LWQNCSVPKKVKRVHINKHKEHDRLEFTLVDKNSESMAESYFELAAIKTTSREIEIGEYFNMFAIRNPLIEGMRLVESLRDVIFRCGLSEDELASAANQDGNESIDDFEFPIFVEKVSDTLLHSVRSFYQFLPESTKGRILELFVQQSAGDYHVDTGVAAQTLETMSYAELHPFMQQAEVSDEEVNSTADLFRTSSEKVEREVGELRDGASKMWLYIDCALQDTHKVVKIKTFSSALLAPALLSISAKMHMRHQALTQTNNRSLLPAHLQFRASLGEFVRLEPSRRGLSASDSREKTSYLKAHAYGDEATVEDALRFEDVEDTEPGFGRDVIFVTSMVKCIKELHDHASLSITSRH